LNTDEDADADDNTNDDGDDQHGTPNLPDGSQP